MNILKVGRLGGREATHVSMKHCKVGGLCNASFWIFTFSVVGSFWIFTFSVVGFRVSLDLNHFRYILGLFIVYTLSCWNAEIYRFKGGKTDNSFLCFTGKLVVAVRFLEAIFNEGVDTRGF